MQNEVLVAIMNSISDFNIAQNHNWYRIPVKSVEKWLKKRWPPRWLAFYQTKIFGNEKWAVNYYAEITDIQKVSRGQLFPDEATNKKTGTLYYQIFIGPLQRLPKPVFSRRFRRIVFISTTLKKFINAVEINDLYDESPLEDRLWAEFRRLEVNAERQEFVRAGRRNYALDFAIYCESGKIDVETDGDTWHSDRKSIAHDNLRDNDLKTEGWRVLRFNTGQIREQLSEYCLDTIIKNINRLGGIKEGKFFSRKFSSESGGGIQLELFDKK
jgi:very-short-patch-repair endonuclease